jgi:hypothetical protein
MIIDAMTTTHRNEYFRNLLEHQRLTLESVTEQRDRLAEACKLLMLVIGDPAENWWPTEDEVNAAWNSGSEALAAAKGGQS